MSGMSSENRVRLMYKYAAQLEGEMRSGEIAPERLGRSLATQWAVVKAIELIGEQAWELRKAGVDLGRAIPLAEIAGMRHRLVHHYEGVDWNVVEAILRDDIPALVENLGRAMEDLGIDPPEV